LVILSLFSIRYVCKLDCWAHRLLAFDFGLKTGCDTNSVSWLPAPPPTLLPAGASRRPQLFFPVPFTAPDSAFLCPSQPLTLVPELSRPPTPALVLPRAAAASLSFHRHQNKLTGALPSDLSPLKAIDQIDISVNHLPRIFVMSTQFSLN
jgi:hypothetical protein